MISFARVITPTFVVVAVVVYGNRCLPRVTDRRLYRSTTAEIYFAPSGGG